MRNLKTYVVDRLDGGGQRGLNAYSVATVLFGIGLGGRFAARSLLPPEGFPFLTFFPVVVLAAFITSLGPSLWCAFLSTLAAWYFFISPSFHFFPISGPDAVAVGFFALVLLADCLVIGALKSAFARLKVVEEQLRAADMQKADFMNVLAHELRTPLQIISNTALMMKRKPEEISERHADRLDRQARQMNRLVEDLLDSARLNSGNLHVAQQRIVLNAILHDVAESLAPFVSARGQSLNVVVPNRDVLVMGDSARLTQVLENLVTNSSKFSPEGTAVSIRLSCDHELAFIDVVDQGRGIPQDQIDRLFRMYVQTSKEDAQKGGIGLGLALAKQIVELHGGKIYARSPGTGHGTTITFTIPITN